MTRAASRRKLADRIEAARSAADDERFNLGHAAALLEMLGEKITENGGADESAGLRVEYLARQVMRHSADLAAALERIERAAMAMKRRDDGASGQPVERDDAEPHQGAGNVVQFNGDDTAA